MSLFAIADLHLSFGVAKPMDIFRGWTDYQQRLERNWRAVVAPEDTVVIAGDISWGMDFAQAEPDFAFIERLPGKKLILKGNHDYWWNTRRKMELWLAQKGFRSISILHNSAAEVGNAAVCGTRGWFFDAEADADKKVLLREAGRLEASILAAEKTGKEPIVFLHYPPLTRQARCAEMMEVLQKHQIKRCYYGHLHGPSIPRAVSGCAEGIEFRLISCDALQFLPVLVEK